MLAWLLTVIGMAGWQAGGAEIDLRVGDLPSPTAEEVQQSLRGGRLLQTVAQGAALLAVTPSAPVRGPMASALATLREFDRATNLLAQAEEGREPGVPFHALCVGALLRREAGRLDEAVQACQAAQRSDRSHPLPSVILAMVRYDQKRPADAERAAAAAIELSPGFAYAHTLLGMSRHAQGNLAGAAAAYQKAVEIDGNDLRPLLGLADLKRQTRDLAGAVEAYQGVLTLNPDVRVAREALATVYLDLGRYEAAGVEAGELLARDPQSVGGLSLRARAQLLSGNYAEAAEAFGRLRSVPGSRETAAYQQGLCLLALGKFDEAESAFRGVPENSPTSRGAVAARGVLEQVKGRPDAAVTLLNQALAGGTGGITNRLHFHRALIELGRSDWADAGRELAQAEGFITNLRPDLLDLPVLYGNAPAGALAQTSLAALFLSEGMLEAGMAACRNAMPRGVENVLAGVLFSNAAGRRLQYDEAQQALERVIAAAPGYAPAYFALGEIHASQQKAAAALPFFEKSAALDPGHLTSWIRVAVLGRANGENAKAAEAFRQWIQLAPDSAVPLNELANHLVETGGDLEEALSLATRAVQLAPNQGALLDTLGWVRFQRKEYPQAIAHLEQAVQAGVPPSLLPEVRLHLGRAYLDAGDQLQARAQFEAILATAPSSPAAQAVKPLLEALTGK